MTAEVSLEELVQERQFAGILQTHAELFFRLSNTLFAAGEEGWTKKHFFQLINEADSLESFLDDYGARFNRTYAYLTELVASIRGFAQAGYSLTHLEGRLESYGSSNWTAEDFQGARNSLQRVNGFLRGTCAQFLREVHKEARELGVEITPEAFSEQSFLPVSSRRRLPRNVGQAELVDEAQKIAEVATKYIQICDMLSSIGIRELDDPEELRAFFARYCTEDRARTYEARIHNLQSTYDTHVQNTVLEAQDERLPLLRAHVSAALHLLEAITFLIHFHERHEDEVRSEEAKQKISAIVGGGEVQRLVVNELMVWTHRHMLGGYAIAQDLLPSYTNVQEIEVQLPDGITLHARPAALLVKVVNHHGTPVEMQVGGKRCNAGSILELLVTAGSNPGLRTLAFHGDERPLRDIRLLIESGLGEHGVDGLPSELAYLRA